VVKDLSNPRADMLLINGIGMTVKSTDTKMMAHLPMLIHPNPENTLVICLGMGTTYRSAISYGKKVTVVELVKEVVDAFDYFYKDASAVRAYPRGRIVVNDGRNFLKVTRENFDVITIDPPPPIDAAGVNNLYSKEFIELAKKHLNKGGIMAHWMPLPGTRSGVDDVETIETLIRTFAKVFPYAYMHRSLIGVGIHIVGSMEPIDISAEVIRDKLSNTAVSGDIHEWQWDTAVSNDIHEWDWVPFEFFIEGWESFPPKYFIGPVITDDKPYLEFYLLRTLRSGEKKMHPENNFW
jgi:spermidine synthase